MAKVGGTDEHELPQGDDTALSIVMSRYVLAVQHERGLPMQSPWTALRTACLTGYTHRTMAEPIAIASGKQLMLSAGDLDKAVSGLLTNHLVASDADGISGAGRFHSDRGIPWRSGRQYGCVLLALPELGARAPVITRVGCVSWVAYCLVALRVPPRLRHAAVKCVAVLRRLPE